MKHQRTSALASTAAPELRRRDTIFSQPCTAAIISAVRPDCDADANAQVTGRCAFAADATLRRKHLICRLHACAPSQEQTRDANMSNDRCANERRLLALRTKSVSENSAAGEKKTHVAPGVHTRAAVEEQTHNVLVAVHRGEGDGRFTLLSGARQNLELRTSQAMPHNVFLRFLRSKDVGVES